MLFLNQAIRIMEDFGQMSDTFILAMIVVEEADISLKSKTV